MYVYIGREEGGGRELNNAYELLGDQEKREMYPPPLERIWQTLNPQL